MSKRQVQVNTDYHATARRLDSRLHGTLPSERGPFKRVLSEYGGAGGRVLGPVVGAFGEASSDLSLLRDLCASEMAQKHVEYFRMTANQALGLFRHQLNRKWGHNIARGCDLETSRDQRETAAAGAIAAPATPTNSFHTSTPHTWGRVLPSSEHLSTFSPLCAAIKLV